MLFDPQGSFAGTSVELRFEMDTLVLLHTCPHPLNPSPEYPCKPVKYAILAGEPVPATDACPMLAGENDRGFRNNELFHMGCCR